MITKFILKNKKEVVLDLACVISSQEKRKIGTRNKAPLYEVVDNDFFCMIKKQNKNEIEQVERMNLNDIVRIEEERTDGWYIYSSIPDKREKVDSEEMYYIKFSDKE